MKKKNRTQSLNLNRLGLFLLPEKLHKRSLEICFKMTMKKLEKKLIVLKKVLEILYDIEKESFIEESQKQ